MKPSRRLVIALVALGTVLAVLVGVGVYGLIVGPPERPEPTATEPPRPIAPRPGQPGGSVSPLLPIAVTKDAEAFARSVALALFEWDTMTNTDPARILDHLMTAAEPSGIEAHGLYQDVRGYLPTAAQWRQLRQYETRQRLSIEALFIPESWPAIAADPANGIVEGVVAVTIDGTRTREGGWQGQQTVKDSPVTFTLFISCAPDGDRCHLLRLSALDRSLR